MRDTRAFLCSTEYVTAAALLSAMTMASDARSIYMTGMCLFIHEIFFYHLEQFVDRLTMSLAYVPAYVRARRKIASPVSGYPILSPRAAERIIYAM